jgi:hypothetical protein
VDTASLQQQNKLTDKLLLGHVQVVLLLMQLLRCSNVDGLMRAGFYFLPQVVYDRLVQARGIHHVDRLPVILLYQCTV